MQYRYLVFTNPAEGKEEAYNRWYDEVHLGEVIAVPGFVAAERYRLSGDAAAGIHRYLAIYEMETDQPEAVLQDLTERSRDGRLRMDPVLAPDIETRLYQIITPRVTG